MQQYPSIGRIVHYTNLGDKDGKYPPEIQAATITGVYFSQTAANAGEGQPANVTDAVPANKVGDRANTMYADLKIDYRSGEFSMQKVPYSEAPERGHWNYPPRV